MGVATVKAPTTENVGFSVITVISNHNLVLAEVIQVMHWEELHTRGAVESALKADRLSTYWMLDFCSHN